MTWVDTIFGVSLLHKIVKTMTLIVPTAVAAISDCSRGTDWLIPSFVAAFLTMSGLIYYNIDRARKPD